MSKLRVMALNMAGGSRRASLSHLAGEFARLIVDSGAHVVLCQEAMRRVSVESGPPDMRLLSWHQPKDTDDMLGALARLLDDRRYAVYFSPSLLSHRDSHPRKWAGSLALPEHEIQAQGNALILSSDHGVFTREFWSGRRQSPILPVEMDLPLNGTERLYRGSRDTEPRIAQGLRIGRGSIDAVVWNVHLTTFEGERGSEPEIGDRARDVRKLQIAALLGAYKAHSSEGREAAWVFGGDFNQEAASLKSFLGREPFQVVLDAPSRPNGGATDNFILTRETRLAEPPRVLVTSRFAAGSHDQEVILDATYSRPIEKLIAHGLDHFPITIDIEATGGSGAG